MCRACLTHFLSIPLQRLVVLVIRDMLVPAPISSLQTGRLAWWNHYVKSRYLLSQDLLAYFPLVEGWGHGSFHPLELEVWVVLIKRCYGLAQAVIARVHEVTQPSLQLKISKSYGDVFKSWILWIFLWNSRTWYFNLPYNKQCTFASSRFRGNLSCLVMLYQHLFTHGPLLRHGTIWHITSVMFEMSPIARSGAVGEAVGGSQGVEIVEVSSSISTPSGGYMWHIIKCKCWKVCGMLH